MADLSPADVGDPPSVWIQWKGTNLCCDFRCSCGKEGHFDGDFAYSLQCGACGQKWVVPRTVQLIRMEDAGQEDQHWHGDAKEVTMDDERETL